MTQLYHNEDCTQFFYTQDIPQREAGETIDRYVDVMAGAGVTVFLINTNSRRTNYRSEAWEAYWDGYEPDGPDDQPFLASIPADSVARYRQGIGNMLAVHQQGIDYPDRVIQRCRHHGVSPWITLRMNDCHCNDNMDHPFHGSFWKDNPQFYRKDDPGYFARCLDYAHQEVRDYYMALIVETLDRYDADGLELDFMREPYLFSAGKEAEGTGILTEWLREVRKRLDNATAKRGHPVQLGVRVPSRPEVASALGLDAIAWTKAGLIDQLVVTPRWATLEFDMPIRQWRDLLGKSSVTLAGGLEINYAPLPDAKATRVSPELATGAAILVLSQGADAVYLFNYFQPLWGESIYQRTLNAMSALDSLRKMPRSIGITYRDIAAPGEDYRAPLRARGRDTVFKMKLGPIPGDPWHCSLLVGLAFSEDDAGPMPAASVNGTPCGPGRDVTPTPHDGSRLIAFSVPMETFAGTENHEINISGTGQHALTVKRVEISFRGP